MSEFPGVPSSATVETILKAQSVAEAKGHEYITLEHLLCSLLQQPEVIKTLQGLNVDPEEMLTEVNEYLDNPDAFPVTRTRPKPTGLLDETIMRAVALSITSSRGQAKPTDLLLVMATLSHEDSFAITLMFKMGITELALKNYLSHGKKKSAMAGAGDENMSPMSPIKNREEAEAFLEQYATNLNKRAAESKIDPLIGRTIEVDAIIQIAARRTKNNAVLVGEPGVGKTAIAEGLALKIVRKEVPEAIENSTVYSLDIASVVAGTRFRGDFEERMKQVIKAAEMIPDSILFIDEIHTVMGAGSGSQGSLDVANILKPALAKGTLRCIGSTTLEEFRKHFEKDRALLRRFKKIDVLEPTIEDAKLILHGLKSYYEEFHKVTFTDAAIDAAVDLTARYVTSAFLPDKAIDVIDSAGARQRVSLPEVRKTEIGVDEIEVEVAKVARIPAATVKEDEKEKLLRLESTLQSRVYGQETALTELSDAVYMSRAGLRLPNKPSGSYLFVGPTGVGKTEAARAIADTLGVKLLKYDMSEYMEKHSVAKLIGAPPGYVGFGEGNSGAGKLVNDIDTHPYCVLLLDEIEKAHPDVFNILLQVMDDGKLTSGSGKEVNFRNVILIMTSNAGASEASKNRIGFGDSDNSDVVDSIIKRMFSPEFRNRLDSTVHFSKLKPEHMMSIVIKFLTQLETMTAARNVTLDLDEDAREWLAKKGYDSALGARPLERVIADNIKKPLSKLMLTGPLVNGGVAIIRVVGEKLLVSG